MRSARLSVFVACVVLAESAFYAVVPPLVPGFVRDLRMTTFQVGVLVAAYPAGVLLAAIPSMALIGRRGVRTGTIAGLVLLVASTLGFAWSDIPEVLDLARLVQGVGGAVAWAGSLAWLTAESSESRASVIGGTLGAALIGMVLGPGIGALASQAGRGPVFSGIALVLAVLAIAGPRSSPAQARPGGSFSLLRSLLRNAEAALGIGLLAGIGVVTGTVAALFPLVASRKGATALVIAVILAASYLTGSLLNVLMGRLSDRFGRILPALFGFAVAGVVLPTIPLWGAIPPLFVAAVVATGSVSSLWTPTAAMVSDGADRGPSGQAVAVATLNAAWAAGAAAGAVGASSLAQAAGLRLPFALLGVLCAMSAVLLLARRRSRMAHGVAAQRAS